MSITNEKEKLLHLYEIFVQEEHSYIKAIEQRTSFYAGLISALFSGLAFGLFNSEEALHYLIILIGCLLSILISCNAMRGIKRLYYRSVETISSRAKVEARLGLTDPNEKPKDGSWWHSDPVITNRHITGRNESSSEKEFMKNICSNQNYLSLINQLFIATAIIGGVILILTVYQYSKDILNFSTFSLSHSHSILNPIGLSLDFLGAILITIFGLPRQVRPDGATFLKLAKVNQKDIKLAKIYKKISIFGGMLISLGFLLQLISSLIR